MVRYLKDTNVTARTGYEDLTLPFPYWAPVRLVPVV